MKTGRPIKYTPEIASCICDQLMDGRSLPEICEAEEMPNRRTILRWMAADPVFAAECARAREEQADFLDYRIQNVINKTENGDIPPDVAKVVMSGLQWRAAKLRPKVYGDKTFIAGDADNPISTLAVRLDAAVARNTSAAPDVGSDLI
jgi:hypothetical protein